MGLFVCDECNCIENTSLGLFWGRQGEPRLCSQCGRGKWHNKFPREQYDPTKHEVLNHKEWGHEPRRRPV